MWTYKREQRFPLQDLPPVHLLFFFSWHWLTSLSPSKSWERVNWRPIARLKTSTADAYRNAEKMKVELVCARERQRERKKRQGSQLSISPKALFGGGCFRPSARTKHRGSCRSDAIGSTEVSALASNAKNWRTAVPRYRATAAMRALALVLWSQGRSQNLRARREWRAKETSRLSASFFAPTPRRVPFPREGDLRSWFSALFMRCAAL